jgi:molybdopterin-guanine dinucleotide biosynthesis protein A
MRIPMPAAVLVGGASRRMGRAKAALPYGAGTLTEFQTSRLAGLFEEVLVVAKNEPEFPVGPGRVVLDRVPEHAAIHGLVRTLEEVPDRVFVLAVDLPAVPAELVRWIAERGLVSEAAAVLPRTEGRLQPLAGVWRRAALDAARRRVSAGRLALRGLAEEVGAEILEEAAWGTIAPGGTAFVNLNTLEDYASLRERA